MCVHTWYAESGLMSQVVTSYTVDAHVGINAVVMRGTFYLLLLMPAAHVLLGLMCSQRNARLPVLPVRLSCPQHVPVFTQLSTFAFAYLKAMASSAEGRGRKATSRTVIAL